MYRVQTVVRVSTWLPVAAVLFLAAGCSMGHEVPAYDDERRYEPPPAPPPMPTPTPDPAPDTREWENARLREEGQGEDFKFKATRDGMVWVVDARERKLLYRTQLDAGEEITVSPFRDVIEIDGKRVRRVDMDNRHRIRIFFERD
ncbi:MAG TPA: hypothetical protein VFB66_27350 [Tepidisphaeraceae bacterium]|nr:hypothetical protein [Tepidisphaeraceae bacterium]